MNLISITIFLSFLNFVTPTPYQINDKEKTAIQYLARIYAMLMNTFDPREVADDFLILTLSRDLKQMMNFQLIF
jgi:hypothetical protein